ncbi:hypothetical protein LCGC14_2566480 [marine sediment metagenome]|uniref:Uncharacterized protein n=1 Tax=marine sediment metagenome TaxID=412755 RepID=A0A0F9CUM7_9ZZZZ
MGENQSAEVKRRRKSSDVAGLLLAIVLLPLHIVCFLIYCILLRVTIWAFYCTRGTNVLFVYSNSLIWKEYLETHVIPELPRTALRLNWSERSKWNWASLPVRIFRHFGGSKEFNPLGVVFRPFRKTKVFRFWKPFRDFKHGKPDALDVVRGEFMKELISIK